MKHTFSILLTLCVLMLIGLALTGKLDIGSEPRSEQGKTLTISYRWEGKSAKVVEQNVTSRIEAILSSVRGVEKVSSVSEFGYGRVVVELKKQADVSAVKFELASLLRQMKGKLPEELSYPSLTGGEIDTGRDDDDAVKHALTYTINADMPDEQIRQIVEREVKPKIERIDGVHHVNITGGTSLYMEIAYDAQKLASYGVSGKAIAEAVRNFTGREDIVGTIKTQGDKHVVPLFLSTSDEGNTLEMMPVKTVDGKIIYLNDLASCTLRQKLPDSYYRVNGMNTIYMNIYTEKDASVVETVRKVKPVATLSGMTFKLTYDRAEQQLSDFYDLVIRSSLTLAILLVFVWLSGGRRWRYLAIITCALAANILISVIIYWLVGLRLHPFSMAGITVSLGIVIDSSIVMVDHYSYYRNRKAFLGILAAMLTTTCPLAVVFWLPEDLRTDLKDFSIVVIINLAVALLVAFLFAPALVSATNYSNHMIHSTRSMKRVAKLTRIYRRYTSLAQHKKWRWTLLLLFALAFGGTLKLFIDSLNVGSYRTGKEKMQLYIRAKMPLGGSVHELNEKIKQVEVFLSQFKEIERYESRVSSSGGSIDISFKEEALRSGFPYLLESKVIGKVITIGGADWSTYGVRERGFSNSLNLQYRNNHIEIAGYDYDRLYRYAEDICRELKHNSRVTDIAIETPDHEYQEDELFMEYDKRKLAIDSVSPGMIHTALSSMLAETDAGEIHINRGRSSQREPLKTRAIVRPIDRDRFDLWQLENSYIKIGERDIRTSGLMNTNRREAKGCIPRENQEYVLRVAFNVMGNYAYTYEYITNLRERIDKSFPVGFRCRESTFSRESDGGTRYWFIGLIAVIIFWICAILFESLKQALTIVLLIPTSLIGLFVTYWLTDVPFGTGGYAAMVMLSGLTVNAGIYILCEFRDTGKYIQAFNHKIIPIMLTVLSTILGMIPFLIDGYEKQPFWYSLAVGTIGGLAFSLIPLVLFLPLLMMPRRLNSR